MTSVSHDRVTWREYRPLLAVSVAATTAAGLLELSGSQAFRPYFGTFSPALATAVAAGLGSAALVYLRPRGWAVVGTVRARGLLIAISLATAFAIPVIAVDLIGGFPRDINVRAPQSLLFYPAIALVAECVFHAVPVALLWALFHPLSRRLDRPLVLWSGIALAALIEPTLQAVWTSADSPWWTTAYVSAHVLMINLALLYFFRRFGFLAAYGFRTLYYVVWHMAWGAVRLPLLFGG